MGSEKTLWSLRGRRFYYYTGGGGLDVNGANGSYLSLYNDLRLVDPAHEFITGPMPDFNQSVTFRFVTNSDETSGNHTTTQNATTTLTAGQVAAQMIVDGDTITVAQAGANVSIVYVADRITIKFSDLHYGSNIVSGKVTVYRP